MSDQKKAKEAPKCCFELYDNTRKCLVQCGAKATHRYLRKSRTFLCPEHSSYVSVYDLQPLVREVENQAVRKKQHKQRKAQLREAG